MMNLKNSLNNLSGSKKILRIMAIVILIGLVDAIYLALEHYWGSGVECLVLEGCEVVLTSPYSVIINIPLAVFGIIFYAGMFILVNSVDIYGSRFMDKTLVVGGTVGFVASLFFLYLQVFVLRAFCTYCLLSFGSSTLLFILAIMYIRNKINT